MENNFSKNVHIFQQPDKAHRIQLLRAVLQNHLQLSGMADTKANIIIGISSVVFSLLLPQVQNDSFSPPTIAMLVTTFLAAFIGILAVNPRTKGLLSFIFNHQQKSRDNLQFNPLFFAAFVKLPEEEYVEYVFDNVLEYEAETYKAMLIDLHRLGVILNQKYKYIEYSYSIFATGLLLSGLLLIFDTIR